MKLIIAVALLIGAVVPASACNSEMLVVREWRAVANEGNKFFPVGLSASVEYTGAQPYRMIHGGVMFADVLGASLGQVNLDRDQAVAPGDILEVDGLVDAKDRLLTVNRDDVVTRTCVWSIVYDDGTVVEF
jgi:hypothetical protein